MEFALVLLIVGVLLLLIVMIFYAGIHPIWSILDCAVSKDRSGTNKAVWIVLTLLTWPIISVLYGLFGTKSPALKRTTVYTVGFSTLICLILGGIVVVDPEARARFKEEITKKISSDESKKEGSKSSVINGRDQTKLTEVQRLRLDAVSFVLNGDYAGAIEIYSNILKLYPGDIEALIHRGHSKLQSRDTEGGKLDIGKGIDSIETRLREEPENGRLYYLKGKAYRYLKKYDLAVANIEKAIRLSPERSNYPVDLQAIKLEKEMESLNFN